MPDSTGSNLVNMIGGKIAAMASCVFATKAGEQDSSLLPAKRKKMVVATAPVRGYDMTKGKAGFLPEQTEGEYTYSTHHYDNVKRVICVRNCSIDDVEEVVSAQSQGEASDDGEGSATASSGEEVQADEGFQMGNDLDLSPHAGPGCTDICGEMSPEPPEHAAEPPFRFPELAAPSAVFTYNPSEFATTWLPTDMRQSPHLSPSRVWIPYWPAGEPAVVVALPLGTRTVLPVPEPPAVNADLQDESAPQDEAELQDEVEAFSARFQVSSREFARRKRWGPKPIVFHFHGQPVNATATLKPQGLFGHTTTVRLVVGIKDPPHVLPRMRLVLTIGGTPWEMSHHFQEGYQHCSMPQEGISLAPVGGGDRVELVIQGFLAAHPPEEE
mmetsp:Transcript_19111/g.60108  ORF Transcript_19111/g.60108 Transcript_19111/m.60108 type:complete len:384 (-) Transcript_19111:368-1519(-)